MSDDFIFHGSLSELDPDLSQLLQREDKRQDSTIILIASESASPEAVREAMSSNFANIYAEAARAIRAARTKSGKAGKDVIYPTAADGLEGVAFVDACVKSAKANAKWTKLAL